MSVIQINTDQVPAADMQILSATFLSAVRVFYSDPQNIEKFEKWRQQRTGKNNHNGGKNHV